MHYEHEPLASTVVEMTETAGTLDSRHESEASEAPLTGHESGRQETAGCDIIRPEAGINNAGDFNESRLVQNYSQIRKPGGDFDGAYAVVLCAGAVLGLLETISLIVLVVTDIRASFNPDDESSRTNTFSTVARICKVDSWIMFVGTIIVGVSAVVSSYDAKAALEKYMSENFAFCSTFVPRFVLFCACSFFAGTGAFCASAMIYAEHQPADRLEVEIVALCAVTISFILFLRPTFVLGTMFTNLEPVLFPIQRELHFRDGLAIAVPASISIIFAAFPICLWRLADGELDLNLRAVLWFSGLMTLVMTIFFFFFTQISLLFFARSRERSV